MSIPFEIPVSLAARYLSGDLVRNGALLREVGTGRIVAHLQETAGLARMAGGGLNPVSIVADGIQMFQNEQIKAGLAFVQHLQVANLALTGAGIGVSIAGFAILARKLDRIDARLSGMSAAIGRVARRVEGIEAHLLRSELAALGAELRRVDEAWSRSDAGAQWRIAADRLLTLEQNFHDHARSLGDGADETALREQMVDAFALASGARISALLAAGEEVVAAEAARTFARSLAGFTGEIGAPQLLRDLLAREAVPAGPVARLEAVRRLRPEAEQMAAELREREDAAATAPLTIAALSRAGIPGRVWLERARSEVDMPLLCLTVGEDAIETVPA